MSNQNRIPPKGNPAALGAKAKFEKAVSHFNQGQYASAKAICEKLIKTLPDNVDVLHLLALTNYRSGKLSASQKLFDKATRLNPGSHIMRSNYGTLLKDMSLYTEALSNFEAATQIKPDYANAYFNKGTVLALLGKFPDAIESFKRASSLNPGDPEIFYNLALALDEVGDTETGILAYDRAIEIHPSFLQAYINKGTALVKLKRFDEAVIIFDKALILQPDYAEALNNKGNALTEADRLEEAHLCFERLLLVEPNHASGYNSRGLLHGKKCDWENAISDMTKAISLNPAEKSFVYYRSIMHLTTGEFAAGWAGYDTRLDQPDPDGHVFGPRISLVPNALRYKDQERLNGANVVLVDEQGVGDTIMFLSMLPDLISRAKSVRVAIETRLISLFSASFPQIKIQPIADFIKAPDLQDDEIIVFTGSLGASFRNNLESFSGSSYLKPSSDRLRLWGEKLTHHSSRRKIGISWRGGTPRTNEKKRSIQISHFEHLLRDDLDLVNIQHGFNPDDLIKFSQKTGRKIISFAPEETNDIHDLAALIASLDAIVTVQNSNVHISGALGIPCLAIIPQVPEWRYGSQGSTMPWYKSVELIRRTENDDPDTLMMQMRGKLEGIIRTGNRN